MTSILVIAPLARAERNASRIASPTHPSALTEAQAVRRSLGRASLRDTIEGAVDAERGRAESLGAYSNPSISYMREQTFGVFGTGEDYVSVSQSFDLARRGAHLRTAAQRRAEAIGLEGEATKRTLASRVRLRFFEALYRDARIAALERWRSHLAGAVDIVAKRVKRGDSARYDLARLEREAALAASRIERERVNVQRARAELGALVELPAEAAASVVLRGTLLPADEPAPMDAVSSDLERHPSVVALDLRAVALKEERIAAGRGWVPKLRVEAGWKGIDQAGGRSDGFLLGVSLSLPLWDRGRGAARAKDGEARALRGRRELAAATLRAEFAAVRQEAALRLRAARNLRTSTSLASVGLIRTAQVAYAGGEMTLLQLLDAYRGSADDALSVTDLEWAARRARIELERLAGGARP